MGDAQIRTHRIALLIVAVALGAIVLSLAIWQPGEHGRISDFARKCSAAYELGFPTVPDCSSDFYLRNNP